MISKKWLHRSGRATSAVLALGLCISAVSGLAQSAATTPGTSTASGLLPAGSFIAAPSIYLGYASPSVATGDLRSSGKLDLVTANSAAGTVVVFLGQGSGKFSSGVSYAAGSQPVAVALADVTGHGHADIVVANGSGNTISVLAGRGDGSFSAPVSYQVGFAPSMLVTGDFSGKGTQEVAVASASGTKLAVFSSDGSGGFAAPQVYSLTHAPAGIVAGDLNRDGHIDLALSNANGTVTPLLNDGTGQFHPLADVKVTSGALSSIAIADFNHDGIADLAVTQSGSRQVSVLLGKGDGTFAGAVSYAVGTEPVAAQIADVDGDGNADLVVVNKSSNTFSVLSGAGDGTFKTAQHFVVGNTPAGAVLGDFYGSGHADLASIDLLSKTVSLPQGKGDGTFQASRSYVTGEQPVAIASADLTGAGHADLAVANYCGSDGACKESGSVAILLADSAGGYRLGSVYPVGSGPVALALRDVNGDGKLDLIALNRNDKSVMVRLGEGDGVFGQVLTFSLSGAPVALASGSFSASGHSDLAVLEDCGEAKCSTAGSVEILAGDGAGNFHSTATFPVGYQPVGIAAGTLTSKSHTDLVVLNRCGSSASCSSGTATILRGDGAGSFTAGKTVSVGANPGSLALGALTKAGNLDLIVSRTGSNSLGVLRGNGDGTFQPAVSYAAGAAPGALLLADFNGDGVVDVAVANASDSTVSVLYGKGDGSLQTAANFPVGAHPSTMTVLSSKGSNQAGIATANGSTSGTTQGSEVTALLKVTAMDTLPPLTSFTVAMSSNAVNVNEGTTITATAVGESTDGVPDGVVTITATNGGNTVTLCSNLPGGTPTGDTIVYTCAATASASLAAGNWTISANYIDGSVYDNNSGSPVDNPLQVSPIAATLAFTTVPSGPITINSGAPFKVTLTASPVTPVKPAGTVTLSQGSTTLCTGTLTTVAPYTASCSTKAITGPSPATITATYTDTDGNFTVATPATTQVTITPTNTTLTLFQATATPIVDSPVILKALVAPAGSPVLPTGTVSFTSNGTNIPGCSGASAPSVGLVGSSLLAICTTSSLTAPSVSIGATYSGDNSYNGSTATALNFAVNKLTPAYTLSAAPQAPNVSTTVNVPVVFTVGFTTPASSAPTQPTGVITVMQGATTLCTVVLPAKTCTLTAGFSSAISYNVTSSYNGDSQFNTVATGGGVKVTVGATGTQTTISGPSTASVNTPAIYTATVTSNVVGATVPQGGVAFKVTDSNSVTTTPCTNAALNAAGTATCSYSFPSSGSYTVNATYNPSPANFTTSSTQTAQPVTVGASAVSITVALDSGSANPSVINQPVKFDSSLTFPTGSAKPYGLGDTIVYYDGTNALCTVPVNATTSPYTPASCTTYALSLGGHSITAAFVPGPSDSNFKAQTSVATTQTVNADPTTISASSSLPSPFVNETYQLSATVTPTFVYSGAGGRSPSGGSVAFTYVNGSSTVTLCTATVQSTSKASCTPAAGSLAVGNYTITATYTDSASPANFVTSNVTTPLNVVKDTPVVKIGTLPASIQVNQALTLSASVMPNYSGPIVPSGSIAFTSGSKTLCTATISSGSASCVAAYADLPASSTPYSISASYVPGGDANFNASSSTTPATVTVTPATTSVKVSSMPTTGYATQTITYTATVSTAPSIPTGGITPTGSVTFTNTSALAFAGTTCPKITIPAGSTFPYSASCTVTYPQTYTGNQNTDTITATFTTGDGNFSTSSNSANPLVQPVLNFSLGFTPSSSSTISLTQGHDTTNDPYFTGQTVAAVSLSTSSSGVGVLNDTLNYTCMVLSSGTPVTDPSCSPATSAALPGASVAYTVNASSKAPAGVYTIAVTATDPNAPALTYTATKQLSIASVSTQQLVFAGSVPQSVSVDFGTLTAGGTLTLVGCPEVRFSTESSARKNPDPTANNQQYVSCSSSAPVSISSGTTTLSVTVTPCQSGTTGTAGGSTTNCNGTGAALVSVKAKAGRSGGSYMAIAFGVPVLAFFGWFGRNRARKNLFRMMAILLLGWSALTVSGCGGGYKLTSPGSSSPATNLAPGTYDVLVQAADASTPANTYYAVVTITVN